MKAIFLFIVATVLLCVLAVSGARAQTFEKLTHEGEAALRSGDWATALDARRRQLAMTAPSPKDHCLIYWGFYSIYTLGTGEMAKGIQAIDESIDCLNAIRDTSRDMLEIREEALRYRAIGLSDWGRYDEALAAVDAMTKLRPDRALAHESTRANILNAKGDYDAAAKAYWRAAQFENHKYWLPYIPWMAVKQKRPDVALSELAKISRYMPYVPGKSSNTRAWLLVEQGKYGAAIAELRNDEKADRANAALHAYLRGYIEAARGDFDSAASAFRSGASANPNNPTVQVALYLAQARAGNASASALTDLAGRLSPTKWPDAQAFYVLGKISRREFEAAATFGNPRIEKTRQCRMTLVAGEVALLKGEIDMAKTDLARTVALCALDPAAQERTWAKGEVARLTTGVSPVSLATPAHAPDDSNSCSAATAHWTSAESIGTRAVYQDHLERFGNCAFATLAAARIAALDRRSAESVKSLKPAGCAPGMSRDSDGDCVRVKAERSRPVRRRPATRAPADSGNAKPALDCTTPAGLFACANHAFTTVPVAR